MNDPLLNTDLFRKLGDTADSMNIELYVVGGYVRDRFLGRPNDKDIDFVVVGDGPAFAKKAGAAIGAGKVAVYKQFGTAMIRHRNVTLEFVGARKESYRGDSRKPNVESADLQTDLARRDFTVNSMAISLNSTNFGELVDPFCGQEDLKDGLLRTPLDPKKTFYDDPLRIMRAVRFATQLNFSIDE